MGRMATSNSPNPGSVENELKALVLGLENSREVLRGFLDGPGTAVMAEVFCHVKEAHVILADMEIGAYVQAILERRARKGCKREVA